MHQATASRHKATHHVDFVTSPFVSGVRRGGRGRNQVVVTKKNKKKGEMGFFGLHKKMTFECPICFYDVTPVRLFCGHRVCATCLRLQLRYQAKCAICRRDIRGCTPSIVNASPGKEASHAVRRLVLLRIMPTSVADVGLTVHRFEEGIVILDVAEQSLAERRGFCVGDILFAINGIPCDLSHEFSNRMMAALTGNPIGHPADRPADRPAGHPTSTSIRSGETLSIHVQRSSIPAGSFHESCLRCLRPPGQ